jgi:hypothetical protein
MSGWLVDLEEPGRGSDGLNTWIAGIICCAGRNYLVSGVVCVSGEARGLHRSCAEGRFELRV